MSLPLPTGPATRRGRVTSYPHAHGRVNLYEDGCNVRFNGPEARRRATVWQLRFGGKLETRETGVYVTYAFPVANPDRT